MGPVLRLRSVSKASPLKPLPDRPRTGGSYVLDPKAWAWVPTQAAAEPAAPTPSSEVLTNADDIQPAAAGES